jgi:hypothetical protein
MKASHPHYRFWLDTACANTKTAFSKNDTVKYLETKICSPEDLELLKANKTTLRELLDGNTQLEADFPALQKMAERHNNILGFTLWYSGLITKETYALQQRKNKNRLT